MSGGHYQHKYFEISQLAEMITDDIALKSTTREIDHGNDYIELCEKLPDRTLKQMQILADILQACGKMAKDLEWFMSGDTGEDDFAESAHEGLVEIINRIDLHYQD